MRIGMMVLSISGNTLQVSERLAEILRQKGHTVTIERVTTENGGKGQTHVLVGRPDPAPYEALIFAAPVQAFHLAEPMKTYMSGIPHLNNKPFSVVVTQHLRWKAMGGNRAVRTLCSLADKKGGRFMASGVVNWSKRKREDQIENVVQTLSGSFK